MKRLDCFMAISRARRGLVILGSAAFLAMLNPEASFAANTAIAVQQNKVKVKGTILDQTKNPIIGASISIKGTTTGTVTDIDGKFSIDVPAGSNLTISFMGYKSQVVKATKTDNLVVILENDNVSLEQVVVVGFGTQKKENLTGAVTAIDAKKALESKPVTNLSKGLQGVAPGLSISFSNGRPGSTASLNIRGVGSLSGSVSPLVLVDGVPSSLDLVNPEDVANISVLKDAASASIYGARAAFGVILITTKTGKSAEKVSFSYSGNVGFNKPTTLVDFMDPEQELPVMIAAQERAGNANAESFGMLYKTLLPGIVNWKQKYANNRTSNEMVYGEDWELIGGRAYFYRVWDPHKEMLNSVSPQTTHNLQVTGKVGENSSYIASVGYASEKGLMKKNTESNEKFTINFGFNTQLKKWLKADLKLYSVDTKLEEPYNYYGPGIYGNGANGYFGYYMRWGKFFPYGTYKGNYFRHAPGYLANANMNEFTSNTIRLSAALVADITKNLSWRNEYSVETKNYKSRLNGGEVKLWDFWSPMDANTIQTTALPTYVIAPLASDDRVAERRLTTRNNVFNSFATFTKSFNEAHNLKVIGGANIEWFDNNQLYAEVRGLMDRSMPEFKLAYGDPFVTGTYSPSVYQTANAGFFTRINYDYKGKYLVELNGRLDGSSSFPGSKLWGFFPSASLGYRITQEPFMEGVTKIMNDAKLRVSYGSIGNQNVGLFRFLPTMPTYKASWINGEKQVQTVSQPTVVDPDLTWENIKTTDLGVDMKFLNSMFAVSFDWYQRETEGMFAVDKTLPSSFGTSAPQTNAGNLRNRGYEITLDFNKSIGKDASVYANLTFSDSKTVVTKWNNASKTLGQYYSGMELGEIWGLETDRLYQESDFTVDGTGKYVLNSGLPSQAALAKGNFTFGPGDVMYKDLNNDGVINAGKRTADDHGDLKKIGNTTPRYLYGIRMGGSYYGFDVEMFFQGVGKRDYWASSDLILPFYNRTDAMYANQSDYWTSTNTGAFFPRPYPGHAANALSAGTSGSNNFVTQTRYLLDMSYFRFKNLTVGYTLPMDLTKKVKIDKIRVYFSGQNLAEKKDSRLPVDPEIDDTEANWGRTYPYSRTFSFGLQVNF